MIDRTGLNDLDLHGLINHLTKDHETAVHWHGALIRHRADPALLDALRDARTGNIGNAAGGSGNAAHERSTLNVAASELYSSIQRQVRAWATSVDVPRHWTFATAEPIDWTDPNALLRAWHVRALSQPRFDEDPFAATLRRWIRSITDLIIDPPRRWSIEAPCPMCGQSVVLDENGDPVLNAERTHTIPALAVTERDPAEDSQTVCQNCSAVWEGVHGARALRIAIDDAAKANAA